jgi:hypothetical protein
VHQQLLDDKSEVLFKHFQAIFNMADDIISDSDRNGLIYIHYLVEAGAFYEYFFHFLKAKELLDEVKFFEALFITRQPLTLKY